MIASLVLSLFTPGCSGVSYLLQAGKGQLALINRARPISEVLKDEKVPPRIRKLLSEIALIKKFGEDQGLKATPNYTDYVNLNRPAAVWVVSASQPYRFEAKQWDFPIVGSFPYLGWFDRENAREYAEELKREGWDVDLRGAAAFSTLGWFKDAILSTMISDGEDALGDLVNVVLHESVHATVYVKGQSYFNESLASFVADRMTTDYLIHTSGKDSPELKSYQTLELHQKRKAKILSSAYQELSQLYESNRPLEEKKQVKAQVFARLQSELQLNLQLGRPSGDPPVGQSVRPPVRQPVRELNNATLIQYKTYNTGEAEFQELLNACQGNWARFLGVMKSLRPGSFSGPQQETVQGVFTSAIQSHCDPGPSGG